MNPHNSLSAKRVDADDRSSDWVRDSAGEKLWTCTYCGEHGPWDDVKAVECSHIYPPCDWCGLTPTCARDCAGIAQALSGAKVYVAGFMNNGLSN